MVTRCSAAHDAPTLRAPRGLPMRWPWLLVAAAWGIVLLATLTGQRSLVDHHYLLEESGLPWLVAAAVFLTGWQVMFLAMMLPASMPTLAALLIASQTQPHRRWARAAFLVGYAATWTGFALLAFAGDSLLHHLVDAWPWLAAHTPLIGAAMLAGAGAFQFSPPKERCLAACHAPHAFIAARYDRAGLGSAWWLGVRHGGLSVGCCWGLMLIMFGIGVGGPGWMLALTGVMVLEVLLPQAWRIRPALGAALLLVALLWLLHPAWMPPAGVS